MHKLVAVTGLCGSGKTTVVDFFAKSNFTKIRLDEVCSESLTKQKKEINSLNLRDTRNEFRNRYGLGALALLNLDKFSKLLKESDVVLDGLYTWEEFETLKKEFKQLFKVITVVTNKENRIQRLKIREGRKYDIKIIYARDKKELDEYKKGSIIALSDFFIENNSDLIELKHKTSLLINSLRGM